MSSRPTERIWESLGMTIPLSTDPPTFIKVEFGAERSFRAGDEELREEQEEELREFVSAGVQRRAEEALESFYETQDRLHEIMDARNPHEVWDDDDSEEDSDWE